MPTDHRNEIRPTTSSLRNRGFEIAATIVALVVLVTGCSDRSLGGLETIRQRGVLRVAVRPGFLTSPAPADWNGDRTTQLEHLAARLGVSIEWREIRRNDELIPALEEGRADLVVSRLSPAVLLGSKTAATSPIEWVDDYLITGPAMPDLTVGDLRGGKVYVQVSGLSPSLRRALTELELAVVPLPEELSAEEVVARVIRGEIGLSVADSGVIERVAESQSLQLFGPLVERRPVVWAVRAANNQLRRAIDDFLFAEAVLTRRSKSGACRDLSQIRLARVLRVVTRNSPTTFYVARGGLEGFEYELAIAFAKEQRMRLELSIPPPGTDPLDWLEEGFGDIAMLHEPVPPSREGAFFVSEPYRRVDLVSLISQRSDAAITFDDIAGRSVAASPPVSDILRLLPVEPAFDLTASGPELDAFSAMQAVSRGEVFAAVVDDDAARLELDNRTDLQRGPVVLPDVPLVWVLNTSSPELGQLVDDFLRRARSSGLVSQLTHKNLGTWRLHVSPRLPPVPEGDLTPFDEYLTWAARQNGLDWRLLASLMYEESRFDPDAVGPGGSAGLFQFMPFTWRELGVEDPHHPGEAIEAGARYLRSLMDQFADLDLPDQVAMAIASYNVGPRHVFDARKLAVEMGFDPDRWLGNVETAMYILDDPEVARRFPAGVCRCRRGAAYTRRILRRYEAYAEQFPPA
ncbi:MAG: transporter substrate-binding domain-containing protein [Candidatus Sulfomarinibacteraceae bacterium]